MSAAARGNTSGSEGAAVGLIRPVMAGVMLTGVLTAGASRAQASASACRCGPHAVVQLPAHGWGPDQFGCLNSIWVRESGWNERAGHPASAYGIPQADPVRHPCQAWACGQARRYYGPLLAVVLGAD